VSPAQRTRLSKVAIAIALAEGKSTDAAEAEAAWLADVEIEERPDDYAIAIGRCSHVVDIDWWDGLTDEEAVNSLRMMRAAGEALIDARRQ
jgi:hypothetical protein